MWNEFLLFFYYLAYFRSILPYFSDVKFSSGASGADDKMFGEEETLSLSFLLQRQRAKPASCDLPFLAHWHLDQRTYEHKHVCKKNI